MPKKTDYGKFRKIKKDIEKLPVAKKELAQNLVQKLEFMNSELGKLQEIIAEKGWTETYQNGANQYGIKKCSEGEVYNSIVKNFMTGLKTLCDMLPESAEEDELEEWLKR